MNTAAAPGLPLASATTSPEIFFSTYRRLRGVGEGTYGVVFEALHIPTGTHVALKRIRLDSEAPRPYKKGRRHEQFDVSARADLLDVVGVPATAIREIVTLRGISHPNIVRLHGLVAVSPIGNDHSVQLWLIFELCDLDLRQHLKKRCRPQSSRGCVPPSSRPRPVGLPLDEVKRLAAQLLRAVAFCHARRILHRDLKPQNLLLAGQTLKVADFGLSRPLTAKPSPLTHEVVTLWYRPPELLLGEKRYNRGVDLWAAGCIIAEMISGQPLFPGDTEVDTLFRIFRMFGTPPDSPVGDWPDAYKLPHFQCAFPKWNCSDPHESLGTALGGWDDKQGLDLLLRLLRYDSNRRVPAALALRHPWLNELPGGMQTDTLQSA